MLSFHLIRNKMAAISQVTVSYGRQLPRGVRMGCLYFFTLGVHCQSALGGKPEATIQRAGRVGGT